MRVHRWSQPIDYMPAETPSQALLSIVETPTSTLTLIYPIDGLAHAVSDACAPLVTACRLYARRGSSTSLLPLSMMSFKGFISSVRTRLHRHFQSNQQKITKRSGQSSSSVTKVDSSTFLLNQS
ncbi:hypothetical protein V6N12_045110 [Hibiscus sabdariffa]|uniref:Uncharacterized protein n=1 Tax=Hibiscus sabdariffa TaxID=183260 RepID=A0ABR2G1V9_9ROSI